jgi:hypothetical protein
MADKSHSALSWLYYSISPEMTGFNNPNQYIVIEFFQQCNTQIPIVGAALLSFPSPVNLNNVPSATILTLAQPCPNAPVSLTPDINVSWDGTNNFKYSITVSSDLGDIPFINGQTTINNCSTNGVLTIQLQICRNIKTLTGNENIKSNMWIWIFAIIGLLLIIILIFIFYLLILRKSKKN